jgi:type I protein arginine methyltransferase
MSQSELIEHRKYLTDERKIAAYRTALAEVVQPGDIVLDLGSGTGLLGYLACEAGAKAVIAVDRGDILGVARHIAAANGYADRITHIHGFSTETVVPTPADVVVCDQIGGLVHDAGILSFYADARSRLLAPDARLVPASFDIFLTPVTFEPGREAVEFWSSRPASIDVGPIRSFAANTEWRYKIAVDDVAKLAPEEVLASFASDHEDPITGSVTYVVADAGPLDGFLGWFEARLSPSVTLTNNPWSPERFERWCNFYPLDAEIAVSPGDHVQLNLDLRPRLNVVSWSTTVRHGDGRTRAVRRSNFNGSFLTSSTVDGYTSDQAVPRTDCGQLIRRIVDLIDGSRTQRDIVELLSDHVGVDFTSRNHLENFVRRVVTLGAKP